MRRILAICGLVALAAVACNGSDGSTSSGGPELAKTFEATAERPYSFRYPAAWDVGEQAEGDLSIGVEEGVGMVLEPVHPWAGAGAFSVPEAVRLDVAGYPAYRMPLGDGTHGRGLAYRVNVDGTDASVWFFAPDVADYDEALFEAIMDSFAFRTDLMDASR